MCRVLWCSKTRQRQLPSCLQFFELAHAFRRTVQRAPPITTVPSVFFFFLDALSTSHFTVSRVKGRIWSRVAHMFEFALAGKDSYWQAQADAAFSCSGMTKEVLYRIDCPYTDCSESRLVLVHEDAVSRLQGLDRISHKRWLDDEVAT